MIKHLILSLLLVFGACGKQVNISTNKLESFSKLGTATAMKEGILIRGTPDKIDFQGTQLNVSKYSSLLTLQFIKTIPVGLRINVRFEADSNLDNGELVISNIENR